MLQGSIVSLCMSWDKWGLSQDVRIMLSKPYFTVTGLKSLLLNRSVQNFFLLRLELHSMQLVMSSSCPADSFASDKCGWFDFCNYLFWHEGKYYSCPRWCLEKPQLQSFLEWQEKFSPFCYKPDPWTALCTLCDMKQPGWMWILSKRLPIVCQGAY